MTATNVRRARTSAGQAKVFSTRKVVDAVRARFEKHCRKSPVIGLAAFLDPQLFLRDAEGDFSPDTERWEVLLVRR